MSRFSAPWCTSLKAVTGLALLILLGVAGIGLSTGPRGHWIWDVSMIAMPLAIAGGSAFYLIRGYAVRGCELEIRRLGWTTRLDLHGLVSATADPESMKGSLRTFGNGGLFCIAGRFRNKRLGPYRAWATDPSRSVVLRFPDRTLVVTPDAPYRFVQALAPCMRAETGPDRG